MHLQHCLSSWAEVPRALYMCQEIDLGAEVSRVAEPESEVSANDELEFNDFYAVGRARATKAEVHLFALVFSYASGTLRPRHAHMHMRPALLADQIMPNGLPAAIAVVDGDVELHLLARRAVVV